LHESGQLEAFLLKTGDMLFINNERNLHGRDEHGNKSESSLDSSRVVSVLSFVNQNPQSKFQSKEFEQLLRKLRREEVLG
jgi:hypothetical protein